MRIRIPIRLLPLLVLMPVFLGCETKHAVGFEEKLLATIPEQYENVSQETFSLDGKRVAYIVKAKDKEFVVVDDKPGTEYDYVNDLQFSLNGKRFGYNAGIGKKYFGVIDGKQGLGSEIMTHFAFSQDGRKMAYAVKQDGKSFVIVDDQIGPQFDFVMEPKFDSAGHVFYLAKYGNNILDDHGWVAIMDQDVVLLIEGYPSDFTFSPDFSFAYVVNKNDRTYMVVNKEISQAYYQVGPPVFSPDGKLLAFAASEKEGATFLVVVKTPPKEKTGGERSEPLEGLSKGPEFDAVSDDVFFRADGSLVAYTARKNGKWIIVADGKELADFDEVFSPILSADGATLAYVAQQSGKEFIVVRDRKGPALDYVRNPRFSDDGRSVGYGARQGKQLWWKVMNLQ